MRRRLKHKHEGFAIISLAALLLAAGVWHFVELTRAVDPPPIEQDVVISARVAGCGDGIVDLGEDCDGSAMNGHTCVMEGFLSGSISCQVTCVVQTSACSMTPPSSGGNPNPPVIVVVSSTNEIFTGYASPGSTVNIFQDGVIVATVIADSAGTFFAQINNIINGTYTFGFQATDTAGNLSALTTLNLSLGGGTVTNTNIFLSPSVKPITSPVVTGIPLTITGQTVPNSTITLQLLSPLGTVLLSQVVTADGNGLYTAVFNTTTLITPGVYSVTAQSALGPLTSTVSLPALFTIGNIPLYMLGDFNENQRVNLVDFSIALYWYKYPLSDAFKILELRHGNGDGQINLVDISIIAYWWTG